MRRSQSSRSAGLRVRAGAGMGAEDGRLATPASTCPRIRPGSGTLLPQRDLVLLAMDEARQIRAMTPYDDERDDQDRERCDAFRLRDPGGERCDDGGGDGGKGRVTEQ